MQIYINVKQAGKRRPVLDRKPYRVPDDTATLRAFLTELVCQEVAAYNEKGEDTNLVALFTAAEIEDRVAAGKVGFGRVYGNRKADETQAVENALQCFADGLVRVFQNEEERTDLDAAMAIREGDVFTLIRLTFLAGRMW